MNKHRLKENIVAIVEQTTGVPIAQIKGGLRRENIKDARHLLCYMLRVKASMTVKEIGIFIGRDHSSISHSLKRTKGLIEVADEKVLNDLREVNKLWIEYEGNHKIATAVTTNYSEEYTVTVPYPEQYPTIVKVEGAPGQSVIFDIEALTKALRQMGVGFKDKFGD